MLESSKCCLQTHGMCICVHRHVDPDGPKLCPYLGDQGEIQAGFGQTPLARGASPQQSLGIMWALCSVSLKTAPKALPCVLAQYGEKESDPLGGREMWSLQGFLCFPSSDLGMFK